MTPDDLLGRVVSTFRFLGLGASGLGALAGGVVADARGLAAPFVVSGVLLVLVGVGLWRHVRSKGRRR
jgi:predicted MFS family arabinose efflux permease